MISSGDNKWLNFDVEYLERIYEKYPENSMIKYILFGFAKSYTLDPRHGNCKKAISIFKSLIQNYNDFRFEEVRQDLGTAYNIAGMKDEAIKLFNETLQQKPALINNFKFMDAMIHALSVNSEEYRMQSRKWSKNRIRGIKKYNLEDNHE